MSLVNTQQERIVTGENKKKHNRITLDIAGAAIFGAISMVVGQFITPLIPRVAGWEIAFFDPISIIWLSAFLIFGFRCGLITVFIGSLGLMPFDPTVWVGPIMKFMATIWFVLVPYYYAKIHLKKDSINELNGNLAVTGDKVKKLRNYIPSMIIAFLIRVPVMFFLNVFVLKYMGWFDFVSLGWLGLSSLTGYTAIALTVLILNTIQSVGDAVLSYLLVFSTKIYDQFKIW
ncbi:MAG: hypothetical protein ACTSVU_00280 [Promethearchaeota archaeon]